MLFQSVARMNNQVRLDEVTVFEEKLRFLILHDWVEGEAEDDHYLYHMPETKSGWMRVSLITVTTPEPEARLAQLFSDRKAFFSAKMGNIVELSEKEVEEEGTAIHMYYWKVGNIVLPDRVYEAVFSYTVLADKMDDAETQQTVELLGEIVSEAVFSYGAQSTP